MKPNEIISHKGKGSRSEILPNRHALNTLVSNTSPKSINDYAKAGAPITQNGPSVSDPEKT